MDFSHSGTLGFLVRMFCVLVLHSHLSALDHQLSAICCSSNTRTTQSGLFTRSCSTALGTFNCTSNLFLKNSSDFIRRAQHADAPTQSDETCFYSIVGVEHCSTLLQLQVPHVASRNFRTAELSCFALFLILLLLLFQNLESRS